MNIFVWFMLIATIGSIILLVYAILNHRSERSLFLIFSSICTFLYVVGYLLEITAPTLEAAFAGVRVQKMGTPFLVVFNYLFIRDIYGEKRLNIYKYILLFALPVFNTYTAQAFPLVRLHYTDIEFFFNGYFSNCHGFPGPISYLATLYNFLLVFLSIRRILRHLRSGNKLQRPQSFCLLAAILLPLSVNIYHTLFANHLLVDLNPFAISLSLIPLIYAVKLQKLFDVVPMARDQVIESMSDAFIVCDKDFSFLDANKAAKQLFPELDSLHPGETTLQVKQFERENELSLQIGGEMRFYKITRTPIQQDKRNNGICIVIHDITDKENQLQKLYAKATFDPLMNIYNRATFFDIANFRLTGKEAKNQSYALLMIDLDHFKMVNDTYGHSCGDAVLQTVAALTKSHFRKNDIVGRYGGEEIAVLLEDISAGQAFTISENLRKSIENTVTSYQEKEIKVTVSIGLAHLPAGSGHELEDMLAQADSALYKAKNSGRNRVRLYDYSTANSAG